MMRIEPRPEMTKAMLIAVPMLSAIASLVIAAVPIAFAGAGILQAYREMFNGVFGSVFAVSEMLTRATPLMFTGRAAALAFRARLWNIGAEVLPHQCLGHSHGDRRCIHGYVSSNFHCAM